jgi:citrate lyase subunit beta / citryl-CoA lyase
MTVSSPLRSVLYVPGNNERAMEKARSLPVDAIIFDLEDAVGSADKEAARARVCEIVAGKGFGSSLLAIRINDPQSKTGEADLHDVLAASADAVVVPKVKTAQELVSLSSKIDRAVQQSGGSDVQIWAMMETPLGVMNVREIAALAKDDEPRLAALIMGTNDLVRETRAARSHIMPWLMDCVLAAKAFGLPIIDGVYNRFDDADGLLSECRQARAMGMDGKTLIHPNQIDICNDSFSPTSEELQEAREIVALFEQAENRDANVLQLQGRMVERLHYEMALETLQIAQLISSAKES